MLVKLRSDKNSLELYRETKVVIGFMLFLSFLCLLFGGVFSFLSQKGDGAILFLPFGLLFLGIGVALLFASVKQSTKLKETKGLVLLSASSKGLSLIPSAGVKVAHFQWNKITRIVLSSSLVNNSNMTEKRKSYHVAIIYFTGLKDLNLLERGKQKIWQTPKGMDYMIISFPKEKRAEIQQKISAFSGKAVKVEIYKRVDFRYQDGEEIYTA